MTNFGMHLSKDSQTEQIDYGTDKQVKPRSAYHKQTFKVRKRTKKRILLLQITSLGLVTWGLILFLNYVIESDNRHVNLDRSNTASFIALSELQLLEEKQVKELPLQNDLATRAQELSQRLQNIRMHNVLRSANASQIVNAHSSNKTENWYQVSTVKSTKTDNIQKTLVQQWEKDFLGL